MKKVLDIGILTRHFISNYGSFLQTFATCYTLDKLGYSPKVINYVPDAEKPRNELVNKRFGLLKKAFYGFCVIPGHKKAYIAFEKIRKNYLPLTDEVDEKTIGSLPPFDAYLSGSDQLWGPIGSKTYDENYFLGFTDSPHKCAYGSSFGIESFERYPKETIRKLLSDYKFIGVREKTAEDYLKSLGLSATTVLDPTFFVPASVYLDHARQYGAKSFDGVLVYQLHHDDKTVEVAKRIAKQTGLPIKYVTLNPIRRFNHINTIVTFDPWEFLSLLDSAKYVVTDSFHCTVFSIIFHKSFVAVHPGKTATRIKGILKLFGLEERMTDGSSKIDVTKSIDYAAVDKTKDELVLKSEEFLTRGLKEMLG